MACSDDGIFRFRGFSARTSGGYFKKAYAYPLFGAQTIPEHCTSQAIQASKASLLEQLD